MNTTKIIRAARKIAQKSSFGGRCDIVPGLMRRMFLGSKEIITVDDFDGDLTISLNLSDHMQSRIYWKEYYSRDIIFFFDKFIKPGMVVLDIGANIGEITITAAKRVTSSGKVVAFEPVSYLYKELEKNIQTNKFSWVVSEKLGISDTCMKTNIYPSCGQDAMLQDHCGLGSLYPEDTSSVPLEEIMVTTLDAYMAAHEKYDRIDLIKIDIEGSELACINGAMQTINIFKPKIIIEIQDYTSHIAGYDSRDIFKKLRSLGYSFQKIGKKGKLSHIDEDSLSTYQNVLCSPEA